MTKSTLEEILDAIYSDELDELDFVQTGYYCWSIDLKNFQFEFSVRSSESETESCYTNWYCSTVGEAVTFEQVFNCCSKRQQELFVFYLDIFDTSR